MGSRSVTPFDERSHHVTAQEIEAIWQEAPNAKSPDEVGYTDQKQDSAFLIKPEVFYSIIRRACDGDGFVQVLKLDVPKERGYHEVIAWRRGDIWKIFRTYVPRDQPLGLHLRVTIEINTRIR